MIRFAGTLFYPHVPKSVGQWRLPDKMLGPSIRAFTMVLFLVSTNMLYLVFRIGGEASLFICAANMFWMLIVTCSIGLLGWLCATSRTYGMSTHLLATIVMGGSWCILALNSAYLGIAVYSCRFCSVQPDHDDLEYCKFLGLSSSSSPPEVSFRPAEAWLSVACTLILTLIVAVEWKNLHLRIEVTHKARFLEYPYL
ncbi:hypothetical protein B0J15DRAFT_287061 [Fusarium solani]|uniref:Uncharacterized protein n=1 Tax=Fusarium solani TaxID=169388 RepID=A0A9P9HMR6_FUSSL|nr:uncharacterized protein B0J15DRAFT_287061 [Fusarium solani]KAH7260494.1 hypothetical protein B0J15DRAFT_287061 [Fusarium solani]